MYVDPLHLEITITELKKRVDESEKKLELALKRISTLEEQLKNKPAQVPPAVLKNITNNHIPSTSTPEHSGYLPSSSFSTLHPDEIDDVSIVQATQQLDDEEYSPYNPSQHQVDYAHRYAFGSTVPTYHSSYLQCSSSPQPPYASSPYPPAQSTYTSPSASAKCLPIPYKPNSLSSSAIKKAKLIPAAHCLQRYSKLQTESKVTVLAVKLARESFFGEDIMVQCTTMGHGRFPALPSAELNELKQTIFSLFPKFWSSPAIYEGLWRNCAEAIGQACKRMRIESEKRLPQVIIN